MNNINNIYRNKKIYINKVLMLILLSFTIFISCMISACAPLVIGTAVGTAAVIYTDRRPANIQTIDKGLQVELLSELERDFEKGSIEVAVWNRRVLLIGAV